MELGVGVSGFTPICINLRAMSHHNGLWVAQVLGRWGKSAGKAYTFLGHWGNGAFF